MQGVGRILRFAIVLSLGGLPFATAQAAPITWIGGNNTWTDGAGNNANWNPADEPDPDDEAIFNTANSVNMGSSNTILALTMSGGIDLFTNDFNLTVGGLTQLVGASTNLFIGGAASTLATHNLTINNGGLVELTGGTLTVLDPTLTNGLALINAGGTLAGNGSLLLDASLLVATLLNNNGTLTAFSRPSNILLPPPAGTLTISGGNAAARIDLDGSGEAGVVNVNRNQTLDIDVPLNDAFNGTMNLFQNTVLDVSANWTLGAGSSLAADNGAVLGFPSIPAGTSTIAGGTVTQSGGTINVVDNDGTLLFTAPFTMTGGSLTNNGLVVFDANATIGAGANFTMPTNNSSITVGAGRTATINQANFNADGNGQTTNILTVNSGGVLILNMGSGADESLSGWIQLNGGGLHVTTIDDTWSIDGTVHVGTGTGISQISGEALTLANVNVTIGANSTLRIAAPLTLGGGGSMTGTGTLAFNQQVTVTASTMLNLTGGTVDLDGTDTVGDQINIQTLLVINAATMEDFGRTNLGGGVNVIAIDALSPGATGSLTVNLDNPAAEWTLNPQGALALISTHAPITMLSGSALNVNGSLTVTGTAGSAARLDIAGTVNVQTAAPLGGLFLQGGTLANPNTIANGQINGPGELQATSGRALRGFGTINAPIDFDGTAELIAEGGTLNVNGGVVDVGTVRVGTAPAVLNLGVALNTSVTDGGIVMSGGTLQGATVTTDSTNAAARSLRGTGTVTSAVVNSGLVEAQGGTLTFTNPASDWDGSGSGHLRASGGGLLELQDTGTFAFTGSVVAVEGSRVFTNGFGLNCGPASSVLLTNGTLEATASTDIGGTVVIGAGPASTMKVEVNSFLDFEPTSTVLLNGDLQLISNNAFIKVGAAFSGNGALIVPEGSNLIAHAGSDINVFLEVQGRFFPGGFFSVGRVDLRDYQQAATGEAVIEITGTSLNQFDRVVVDGDVAIEGKLTVEFFGGFTPSAGNAFTIFSGNSVAGTFDEVQVFGAPAGVAVLVQYMPSFVRILVLQSVPGDMNGDFDVDENDWAAFRICLNGPGVAVPPLSCPLPLFNLADIDGDNDVDMDDVRNFLRCFGGAGVIGNPACAD